MAIKVYRPIAAQFPISSPYGQRKDPVTGEPGATHYGIDFACPVGTPIVAAFGGRIFKAGWQDEKDEKKGFGKRVWQTAKIDGKDVAIFYAHLSDIAVREGETAEAGTRVGLSGNTGKSSGPHLHFEIRVDGKGVPIEFIGG